MDSRAVMKLVPLFTLFVWASISTNLVNSNSALEIVTKEDIQEYLLEFFKIFNQQLESWFGLNSTAYSENLNYTVDHRYIRFFYNMVHNSFNISPCVNFCR